MIINNEDKNRINVSFDRFQRFFYPAWRGDFSDCLSFARKSTVGIVQPGVVTRKDEKDTPTFSGIIGYI
jgi:hypothetical protein